MRLTPEQLSSHLQKPLQKVYLVSGDEPMQKLEAADKIRQAAKSQGILEREVIFIDAKFSWESLFEQGGTMSLFAEKKMLDIRLDKFPVRNEQKTFLEFLENIDESTIVLLTSEKLDGKVQKHKWAQHIANQHVWMPVWPITMDKLPRWLMTKANEREHHLSQDAADYLANQVEGNLLAAIQELDKACLMVSSGADIERSLLEEQVSDNARFTPWELLDVTFLGASVKNKEKIPRIMKRLQQEKVEPMVLAKTLQRDTLQLEKMTAAIEDGQQQRAVFQDFRVWGPKQAIYTAAMKRYRSKSWQRLWVRAMALEKIIVGKQPGNFWDECLELCLLIAGLSLWAPPTKKKSVNVAPTPANSNSSQSNVSGAEQARAALRAIKKSSESSFNGRS